MKTKVLVGCFILGIIIALLSGLILNDSGIGIPEIKHFGYPIVWRTTDLNRPTSYGISNLLIDIVFWSIILMITSIFLKNITTISNHKTLLIFLILLIPSGILMCFIHELGHAFWGTVGGGNLSYLQVMYLIIYPQLALTSDFHLGLTGVEGLTYGSFEYGLFLLGGSITTTIITWLVTLVLVLTNINERIRLAMKSFILWGILDLPFYVLFPQIGLRHWIIIGGSIPEPLIGARMMSISDTIFYLLVFLSTIGLVLLFYDSFYFKKLCNVIFKREKYVK
jgi:hypothetical protein